MTPQLPDKPQVLREAHRFLGEEADRGVSAAVRLFEALELVARAAHLDHLGWDDESEALQKDIQKCVAEYYTDAAAMLALMGAGHNKVRAHDLIDYVYGKVNANAPKMESGVAACFNDRDYRPMLCAGMVSNVAVSSASIGNDGLTDTIPQAIGTLLISAINVAPEEES